MARRIGAGVVLMVMMMATVAALAAPARPACPMCRLACRCMRRAHDGACRLNRACGSGRPSGDNVALQGAGRLAILPDVIEVAEAVGNGRVPQTGSPLLPDLASPPPDRPPRPSS